MDAREQSAVGLYSLASQSVTREALAPIASLERLPRYPVPAVLLARFAVDAELHGQGMGSALFAEMLRRVLALSKEGPAARVLVTDAKNPGALRFYERHHMTGLRDSGWPRRMALDLQDVRSAL